MNTLRKILGEIFTSLFNFLGKLLTGIVDVLWVAFSKVFGLFFSLLGTIWGRLLATLTLLVSIALSPLVEFVTSGISSLTASMGASPDVVASLFPNNFQALCYVAVNFCSLDIMVTCAVSLLAVKGVCFTVKAGVWAARKTASVVRGAGV